MRYSVICSYVVLSGLVGRVCRVGYVCGIESDNDIWVGEPDRAAATSVP